MLKILWKSYFPFVAIVKILCFYCVCMFQKHEGFFYGFLQIQANQRHKEGVRFDY